MNIYSEFEKRALLLTLSKRGSTKPKNWKLVHSEVCGGDELTYNSVLLTKRLSKNLKFAVSVESNPNLTSRLDSNNLKVRYRYVLNPKFKGQSAIIATSRDFCKTLISRAKLYRIEDINIMSFQGANPMTTKNYSIFQWKGSYGCRHSWMREVYAIERDNKEVGNNPTIDKQIEK